MDALSARLAREQLADEVYDLEEKAEELEATMTEMAEIADAARREIAILRRAIRYAAAMAQWGTQLGPQYLARNPQMFDRDEVNELVRIAYDEAEREIDNEEGACV